MMFQNITVRSHVRCPFIYGSLSPGSDWGYGGMIEIGPLPGDRHFIAKSGPIHNAILWERIALADVCRPLHNLKEPRRPAVYLFEPERTSFDLKFVIFGIHIRVHPMFWFITAVMGWNDRDMRLTLLWIGVVFLSILIHELGHVLMGKVFGSFGHIVLYGFGGLAIGSSNLAKRWQRNLVYFAGPLAQFILLGVVIGIWWLKDAQGAKFSPYMSRTILYLYYVNLVWPILNLLPIWPLDGGRISREAFQWILPTGGTAISLIFSATIAGFLAIHAICAANGHPIIPFLGGSMIMALFAAMFAISNLQELVTIRHHTRRTWEQEEDSW
jgi:Zn-dependent protease